MSRESERYRGDDGDGGAAVSLHAGGGEKHGCSSRVVDREGRQDIYCVLIFIAVLIFEYEDENCECFNLQLFHNASRFFR